MPLMSWGFLPVTIATAAVLVTAGCASSEKPASEPPVPTATPPNASIAVEVDCGTDGVANVVVSYGTGPDETTLVGRNPTTLAAGGVETFSSKYGTAAGFDDAPLTVTTSPTRGTCKTTITDYNSGNVLGERETAGRAILKAVVPGDPA